MFDMSSDAQLSRTEQKLEDVKVVAGHYKEIHPAWNMKSDERRICLEMLSCGYSASDLCDAITGLHMSPHHLGKNKSGAIYLGFCYAFREKTMDGYIEAAKESRQAEIGRKITLGNEEEKLRQEREDRLEMEGRAQNGYRAVDEMRSRMMQAGDN